MAGTLRSSERHSLGVLHIVDLGCSVAAQWYVDKIRNIKTLLVRAACCAVLMVVWVLMVPSGVVVFMYMLS